MTAVFMRSVVEDRAWRAADRVEARFVSGDAGGPDVTHAVAHDAIAAEIAALLDLPEQPLRGQGGIGRNARAQIRFKAIDKARRRRALLVGWRLQPLAM
jgi:hypothetical protein